MSEIYNWQKMKDTVDKTLEYKEFYAVISGDNSVGIYKDREKAIVSFLWELLHKLPKSWFKNTDYLENHGESARIDGSMKMSEIADDNQTFEEVLKSHFVDFGKSTLTLCPFNKE